MHGFVTLPELTLELAADLERLAPFGAGNPPLVLAARDLKITNSSAVGRGGEHTRMTVADQQGNEQRAIWWQSGTIPQARIDLAFSLRTSTYKGKPQLQVEWIDARPAEGVLQVHAPTVAVVDDRDHPDPLARLRGLGDVLIWREVDAQVEGKTRLELAPAPRLAIWTIPPGSAELRDALAAVKPETVYLFAHDPGLDTLEPFAKRLVGLINYMITHGKPAINLAALAAATAQREVTVQAGLDWLSARGQINLTVAADGTPTLSAGDGQAQPDADLARARLTALLRETAAYRAFYRRADPNSLISG